MAQLGTDPNN